MPEQKGHVLPGMLHTLTDLINGIACTFLNYMYLLLYFSIIIVVIFNLFIFENANYKKFVFFVDAKIHQYLSVIITILQSDRLIEIAC